MQESTFFQYHLEKATERLTQDALEQGLEQGIKKGLLKLSWHFWQRDSSREQFLP